MSEVGMHLDNIQGPRFLPVSLLRQILNYLPGPYLSLYQSLTHQERMLSQSHSSYLSHLSLARSQKREGAWKRGFF